MKLNEQYNQYQIPGPDDLLERQKAATYTDGALVNQVTDSSYQTGGVGLSVWQSKTLFRDTRFRLMN